MLIQEITTEKFWSCEITFWMLFENRIVLVAHVLVEF